MMTTEYTRSDDDRAWIESARDLSADELATAVYAVEASDNGGRSYACNGLRWQDIDSAKLWAAGLSMRWFGATNIRVVRVEPGDGPAVVLEVLYQTL